MDSAVAIGTPPSSKPASASIPGGMSAAKPSATAVRSFGSDSNRYLSKYSSDRAPDRRRNWPRRRETSSIWRARFSLFTFNAPAVYARVRVRGPSEPLVDIPLGVLLDDVL